MRGVVIGRRAQLPWKGEKQTLFLPLAGTEQTAAHWLSHSSDHKHKGQQRVGFLQHFLKGVPDRKRKTAKEN